MLTPNDYNRKIFRPVRYAVGEKFPFANPEPGREMPLLVTNSGFITLAFFSQNPGDVDMWRYDRASVALWVDANLMPFLVLGFEGGMYLDFFLNSLKLSPESWQGFIESQDKQINIMLINEATGNIMVNRPIPIPLPMFFRIRQIAFNHRETVRKFPDSMTADGLDRMAELTQQQEGSEVMFGKATSQGAEWFGFSPKQVPED